ncbi:MAG: M23 family metallopeptidase [Candidatus Amulumruptor caecigallinarius]|nr:M23 family metallopeptidase [Candidatus Amulumruptor caecigallinarius]
MRIKRKYRIIVEDESHLSTISDISTTRGAVVATLLAAFVVSIFISGLIIWVTPLKTLLPGYMKESQRAQTEEALLRLDSIRDAYERNRLFIANYLHVTDPERNLPDSVSIAAAGEGNPSDSLMEASKLEREFVSAMEERERFNISVLAPLAAEGILFSPVSADGVFSTDSRNSTEGDVILGSDAGVLAAADGSVIAVYYSIADSGYVVVVQHARGFVSSYLHVGAPLVGVGDTLYAGQIIALAPAPDSKGTRKFNVRMWHNGLPVIPYQFVGSPLYSSDDIKYDSPRGK